MDYFLLELELLVYDFSGSPRQLGGSGTADQGRSLWKFSYIFLKYFLLFVYILKFFLEQGARSALSDVAEEQQRPVQRPVGAIGRPL